MAIVNISTDFFIWCLPIPMLYHLQLPRKQKVLLGLVFALGSGVIVISIVRIIYVYKWIGNPDATYNQAAACIFSLVEINGGVICACIVLLKPFFQKYTPWVVSLSNRSGSGSGSRKNGIFGKRRAGESHELRSAEEGAGKQRDGDKLGKQIAYPTTYNVPGKKTVEQDGDSMEDLFAPGS